MTVECVLFGQYGPFRTALNTPNVRTLYFDIELNDGLGRPYVMNAWQNTFDVDECLDLVLCHEEYPWLEHFTYKHIKYYGDSEEGSLVYEIPFRKMPKLRDLELNTPQ